SSPARVRPQMPHGLGALLDRAHKRAAARRTRLRLLLARRAATAVADRIAVRGRVVVAAAADIGAMPATGRGPRPTAYAPPARVAIWAVIAVRAARIGPFARMILRSGIACAAALAPRVPIGPGVAVADLVAHA